MCVLLQFEDDVEVIAIDPEREYSDDEQDDDETSVSAISPDYTSMNTDQFHAAMQESGHRYSYQKSISLPHSPTHYALALPTGSLDDMDLLAASPTSDNIFDLTAYIEGADDNFDVIPPSQLLQTPKHPQLPQRTCAISAKKMHYNDVEPDVEFNSSDDDDSDDNETEEEEQDELKDDNPKCDPTWTPAIVKPVVVKQVKPVMVKPVAAVKVVKKPVVENKVQQSKKQAPQAKPAKPLTKMEKTKSQERLQKKIKNGKDDKPKEKVKDLKAPVLIKAKKTVSSAKFIFLHLTPLHFSLPKSHQ